MIYNWGLSYEISASVGYFIRNYDSQMSLDECVKAADEVMFVEKSIKHQQQKNNI